MSYTSYIATITKLANGKIFVGDINGLPQEVTPWGEVIMDNTGKFIIVSSGVTVSNADEITKGIVEEATQTEMNAGTDTGGTGAKLFAPPSKIKSYTTANLQPLGNELTALQALADTAGFVKKTGDGAYSIDTSTYLTSVTAHNLLSATHGDTTAAACVRGDIIRGSATATWERLAKGSAGKWLTTDATDLIYSTATLPITATGTGTILRADGTNWVATTNTYPNTTPIGQILYATAANVIGGATDFLRLSTGELIVGGTALFSTEFVSIQKSQNAQTSLRIKNATSGTAALTSIVLHDSANLTMGLHSVSALYTTSGIFVQNMGVLVSTNPSGMNMGTTVATPVSTWTNNTERVRILSTGEFLHGATALSSTEFALFQKNQNALTWVRILNTTAGTAARAAISLTCESNYTVNFQVQSNSYTSSGILVAGKAVLNTSSTTLGLNLGTVGEYPVELWTNNTKKVEISSVGNMSLGGVATRGTTVGTYAFQIFDGTAPAGTLANGVSLFSAAGKLKSIDAAGTVGWQLASSAVTTVNPTAPNRTLTVEHNGVTYYLHCKTTND